MAMPGMQGVPEQQSSYSFEGYPVEEVKQRYGKEPYRLQDHEQKSIDDVKRCTEKGMYEKDTEALEESIVYLQSLVKKLSMTAMAEQNEGIMNVDLRSKIEEVKALYAKLMARMQVQTQAMQQKEAVTMQNRQNI
ncbi:hypothetical protein HYV82_06300 [Candidatus Woesearchaeota archaeon]|nr:hypothetical protein [Candidatus Woesearchaeota archaeon]